MINHPILKVTSVLLAAALFLSACSVGQILPSGKVPATEEAKKAATATPDENDLSAILPLLTCSFSDSLGAITIEDQTASFTCGRLEGLDVVLYGKIVSGDQGWQIPRAYLSKTEDGYTIQKQDLSTISAVDLEDGSRCEAVAAGTDVKIGSQVISFTCGGEDNKGFVLLGDVIPSELSWKVTKAAISKAEKGFTADSTTQVAITSLEVQ